MTHNSPDVDHLSDADLAALFDEVADHTAEPSAAFMARIAEDAIAEMPAPAHVRAQLAPRGVAKTGWLAGLIAQIGGARGVAGLTAAGVCGLLIGYADPSTLDGAATVIGLEVVAYDVGDMFATFPTLSEDG